MIFSLLNHSSSQFDNSVAIIHSWLFVDLKMTSFILQLLIVLAIGLMVQSAPVNDVTKRSAKEKKHRKLENNLYCTAQSLDFAGRQLQLHNKSYILLISNNIKINMNRMLDHFSNLCKNFIIAMTLKHQLQEHLFNDDTALEVNSDNAKTISTILTSLETMANIFDDMQFNKDNSRCVKLTPAQYRIMYYVRYTAPLLESLKDDLHGWYLNPGLYEYQDERHCN